MVAFLALRVLYVVVLGLFRFCFLALPPESLPGDDACPVQATFTPSSLCLLSSLFVCLVLFCFFATLFVPDLFWCNFLCLVTTAGFVADQFIM